MAAYERREADLADEREELLHEALMASDHERQRLVGDLHDGVTPGGQCRRAPHRDPVSESVPRR
jgi:signal transduction histidine kinase